MSSDVKNLQRLRDVLTPAELALLVRIMVDELNQHQIAALEGRPQSTIASRVTSLRAKLIAAGIPAPLPKRGRREGGQRLIVRVDPEQLDRLTTTDGGQAEPRRGRWISEGDGSRANDRKDAQ